MAVAETAESCMIRQDDRQEEKTGVLENSMEESLAAVRFLASRLATRLPAHVDVDDLVQVGMMGMIQSAERFDQSRGVKFQTYANRRVQGAMLDYLRSLDWRPRSVRKRNRKLAEAVAAVEQRKGCSASEEEIALEISLETDEFHEWMRDFSARGNRTNIFHPDSPARETTDDFLSTLADPSDSPEERAEKQQMNQLVVEAIQHLPENERIVMSLYYYEQVPMRVIGQRLGVKQARVSQLHTQALRRLRIRIKNGRPLGRSLPCAAPAAPRPSQLELIPVAAKPVEKDSTQAA